MRPARKCRVTQAAAPLKKMPQRRVAKTMQGSAREQPMPSAQGGIITTVAQPGRNLPIPPLIWRNIVLFALCQTFTGAGMQFAYGFGPLMIVQLTGSPAL